MTSDDRTPDTAASGCPVTGSALARRSDAVRIDYAEYQRDPGEWFRRRRWEHGPVVPVLLEDDVPAWLVIGYREVHEVLNNAELFARDPRRWNFQDQMPENWGMKPLAVYYPSIMSAEGADHRRRAGAISDVLAAVDQFELSKLTERLADEVIDSFVADGTADLIWQYADRIPLLVFGKLYGLSDSEADALVAGMVAIADADETSSEGQKDLFAIMQRLLDAKRDEPGPDIASWLITHPAELTDEEMRTDLQIAMTAAHQPLACWIGNTLRLMLTDSHFAVSLSGGRRSVGQSLNEVLWEDTPTQNYLGRWAARGTQLGGQHIQAGDLVVFSLSGAHFDPRVRPNAHETSDESGKARGNNAHLSFSYGEHGCPQPAPELAQIITKTAVEVLLDRLPDVDLTVAPEELTWRPSVIMRGLTSLPVTFTPE